jgi:hypothetical protein
MSEGWLLILSISSVIVVYFFVIAPRRNPYRERKKGEYPLLKEW